MTPPSFAQVIKFFFLFLLLVSRNPPQLAAMSNIQKERKKNLFKRFCISPVFSPGKKNLMEVWPWTKQAPFI